MLNYDRCGFQQNNLLNEFTALENVAIPLVNNGWKWEYSLSKATKILSYVGLSRRLNHFPSELSGGEQQRVAIARALINDPKLIIADEMTGNLDEKTADTVFEFFLDKISSNNQTLIYVTHNEKYAKKANTAFEISNNQIHKI